MDITLADLTIKGRVRKVLMQAPKNGFFYVIDRTNGKLISAEPFAKVTWASSIDLKTGRPVENPEARYRDGKSFEIWPGPTGAHNWLPMAFSPRTGLVYLPASDRPVEFGGAAPNYDIVRPGGSTSRLIAWDPITQKPMWKIDTPGIWGGGVVATAGDVIFQGQIDDTFNAYDARSGKKLWTFDTRAPAVAPPITFAWKVVQYVTVVTGYGGSVGMFAENQPHLKPDYRTMHRRVLTFALDGKAVLPPKQAKLNTVSDDPTYAADPEREMKGYIGYSTYCSLCHGMNAVGGGAAPDLRRSPIPVSRDSFHAVVRGGALMMQGMPNYSEQLTEGQAEEIRLYLRSQAQKLRAPESAQTAEN